MGFQFEFDAVNKILLMRFEGRLTDESLTEVYWAIRKYMTATDARAGIWDFSSVTEFAVPAEFIRYIASLVPASPDMARPRFIVVKETFAFGLARMFEIVGEPRNPLLKVVYTLHGALAALGVQSPQFEPLE